MLARRFLALLIVLPLLSATAVPVSNRVPFAAELFPLSDVRLLDGSFRDAQKTGMGWLLRVDDDRMLHNFRATAGLPSTAKPYGGWEDPKCELRGHSLGHYLSALSTMYAATGDERFKKRLEYLVDELAKCQAAMPAKGYGAGYLSGYPLSLFDRVDNAQPVWAPYYTLHKIYAGLLDAHRFCGNAQSLEILRGMADWLDGRFGQMPREKQQKALGNEHGGMAESIAELYARTGEPRYLKLAESFRHDAVFDPAARVEDKLTGLHANTQFPKFIGYERYYELTGDESHHAAAANFWTFVVRDRSFVIGGNSIHEGFFPVDKWEPQLRSVIGPESCNTYNMLRLTAELSQVAPTAAQGDFYERGLFNHLRSHQHPDDGNFVYYTSLQPGSYRNFSRDDGDFWCCVGTGMETPARYGEAIYGHGADRLFVHQFIASELTWREAGAVVRQETKFPEEPSTHLTLKLEKPRAFAVSIRKPSWAGEGFAVTVNGGKVDAPVGANGYAEVKREWRDGDRIDVAMPMTLWTERLPHSSNFVAILYGPVVLAGKLGRDGLVDGDFRGQRIDAGKVLPAEQVPTFVGVSPENVLKRIEAMPGKPLHFVAKGLTTGDCTLAPFASFFEERYTVYWPVFADEADLRAFRDNADPYRELREKLAAGSIDCVLPGDRDHEALHRIHSQKSGNGVFRDRPWRDARDGWFEYEFTVVPGQPYNLVITYWGGDGGDREFDVLVERKVIASQKLANNKPCEFFEVVHPLTEAMIGKRDKVRVRFEAHPGKIAGGVFGVRIVKAGS